MMGLVVRTPSDLGNELDRAATHAEGRDRLYIAELDGLPDPVGRLMNDGPQRAASGHASLGGRGETRGRARVDQAPPPAGLDPRLTFWPPQARSSAGPAR